MLGRAVTGGSTPSATLFELALFRMFVGKSLFTQSCGESVASGLTETEKDSNLDTRRAILEPSHHGPYDAHHVAGEPRP